MRLAPMARFLVYGLSHRGLRARRSEIAPLPAGLGKRLIAPGRLTATAGGVTSQPADGLT
jgi:hypothetical protein